ncbi:MAG: hypothetical protein J6S69_04170, partial [Proteobacteria bacterium]|nr:hypothetical protein [Pseudomonadota bacterium]
PQTPPKDTALWNPAKGAKPLWNPAIESSLKMNKSLLMRIFSKFYKFLGKFWKKYAKIVVLVFRPPRI